MRNPIVVAVMAGSLFGFAAGATGADPAATDALVPTPASVDNRLRARELEERHRQRVIEALGERNDADALLARVMIGRFDRATGSSDMPVIAETARQAAVAEDAGPHVLLRLLQLDLLSGAERDALLARLKAAAPGNLAVTLAAVRHGSDVAATVDEVDRWLAEAAQADRLDSYFDEVVTVLADAYEAVEPDDALVEHLAAVDAELEAGLIFAIGLEMAIAMHASHRLVTECHPDRAGRWHALRQNDCLRIARLMSERSDTLGDASLGLAVWRHLATATGTESEQAALAEWVRRQQILVVRTVADADLMGQYVRDVRQGFAAGRSERDLTADWVHALDIPIDPPSATAIPTD